MFSFISDGYTEIENSNFKDNSINNYAGIYVEANPNNWAWFERFENQWTWETPNGKFLYEFPNCYHGDQFISDIKEKLEVSDKDDFFVRVYEDSDDLRKIIGPSVGKYPFIEWMAHTEMERLGQNNIEQIYKDSEVPDNQRDALLEEFAFQHNIISEDVEQLVRMISAQGHNEQSMKIVLNCIESLIRNIPLSPIVDNELAKNDWAIMKSDEKEYDYILNLVKKDSDPDISEIAINARSTNIVRVKYSNDTVKYFDTKTSMYTKNKEDFFISKDDVKEVTLPWEYHNPDITVIDENSDISDLIPIKF